MCEFMDRPDPCALRDTVQPFVQLHVDYTHGEVGFSLAHPAPRLDGGMCDGVIGRAISGRVHLVEGEESVDFLEMV